MANGGGASGAHRKSSVRQEEILAELEDILFREGLRNRTIAELTERLSCSRETLYAIAPTRTELIALAAERLIRKILRESEEALDIDDPVDGIRRYMRLIVRRLGKASPGLVEELNSTTRLRAVYDEYVETARGLIERTIAKGIRQGSFRQVDPSIAWMSLWLVVLGLRSPDLVNALRMSQDEALARMTDLFLHGLLSDAGSAAVPAPSPPE